MARRSFCRDLRPLATPRHRASQPRSGGLLEIGQPFYGWFGRTITHPLRQLVSTSFPPCPYVHTPPHPPTDSPTVTTLRPSQINNIASSKPQTPDSPWYAGNRPGVLRPGVGFQREIRSNPAKSALKSPHHATPSRRTQKNPALTAIGWHAFPRHVGEVREGAGSVDRQPSGTASHGCVRVGESG